MVMDLGQKLVLFHKLVLGFQTTRHYELLNYSEHGTTVDNVLYSCDFSDKPVLTPQPTPLVASVRKMIGKRKQKLQQQQQQQQQQQAQQKSTFDDRESRKTHRLTMSARATEVSGLCEL